MRLQSLLRVAAEAEGHRLRGMVTRIATRAGLGVVAALFAVGALAFWHLTAWDWLIIRYGFSFVVAALIVAGADLLVAAVFALAATRSSKSRVEREAMELRRNAMEALRNAFRLTQLAAPILGLIPLVGRSKGRPVPTLDG